MDTDGKISETLSQGPQYFIVDGIQQPGAVYHESVINEENVDAKVIQAASECEMNNVELPIGHEKHNCPSKESSPRIGKQNSQTKYDEKRKRRSVRSVRSDNSKFTKSGKKYYVQLYKKEWEEEEQFFGWLSASPKNPSRPFCNVCFIELKGSRTVLVRHGETSKHAKNFEELQGKVDANKSGKTKTNHSKTSVMSMPSISDFTDSFEVEEDESDNSGDDNAGTSFDEEPKTSKLRQHHSPHNSKRHIDHLDRESLNHSLRTLKEPLDDKAPFNHILHSGYFNKTLRKWQSNGTEIHPWNLMYPLHISDDRDESAAMTPLEGLPEIFKYNIHGLADALTPIVYNGLSSVLLIPAITVKNKTGSNCLGGQNPLIQAIKKIKSIFPHITVACDVCLCAFTDHGGCAILTKNGTINSQRTIELLVRQSLIYAEAGADIVSPSDMMDGRIGAIKERFRSAGIAGRVTVLSTSAHFASPLCHPGTQKNHYENTVDTKSTHQLPTGSAGLALRAIERDIVEGTDMIMVKPAHSYLDIVHKAKEMFPNYPLFVYQVSGEYSLLHHSSTNGICDLRKTLMEILTCIRRAGAEVIISYYTPNILQWLKDKDVIIIRF